jgi:hypothetical protein
MQYEIITIELNADLDADLAGKPLADYGREGWQVVAIQDQRAVLQRPALQQIARRMETK